MSCLCGCSDLTNCKRGVQISKMASALPIANGALFPTDQGNISFLALKTAVLFGFPLQTLWPSYGVAKLANYTITSTIDTVAVDASAGPLSVFLPALQSGNYKIIKIDSSVNAVSYTAAGADKINGVTTGLLTAQYDAVEIIDSNTEWLES